MNISQKSADQWGKGWEEKWSQNKTNKNNDCPSHVRTRIFPFRFLFFWNEPKLPFNCFAFNWKFDEQFFLFLCFEIAVDFPHHFTVFLFPIWRFSCLIVCITVWVGMVLVLFVPKASSYEIDIGMWCDVTLIRCSRHRFNPAEYYRLVCECAQNSEISSETAEWVWASKCNFIKQ